jgi:dTDP-4-dehydrorhamnose reductase
VKVLITGSNGLLGFSLFKRLKELGHHVVGLSRGDGDLVTQPMRTLQALVRERPDAVINCVGLANVDKCEDDPVRAWLTNAESVVYLARLTHDMGIYLMHISTDHVFAGKHAYYTEDDTPTPVNVYGWSKAGGERACLAGNPNALVIRTNFYGWAPEGRPQSFADWMFTSLRDKKPIQLFKDYFFTALHVHDLADALDGLLRRPTSGIMNVCSTERMSKYDFGVAMADIFGLSMEAVTVASVVTNPLRVSRPKDLSLSTAKFEKHLGYAPATTTIGLSRMLREKVRP